MVHPIKGWGQIVVGDHDKANGLVQTYGQQHPH